MLEDMNVKVDQMKEGLEDIRLANQKFEKNLQLMAEMNKQLQAEKELFLKERQEFEKKY